MTITTCFLIDRELVEQGPTIINDSPPLVIRVVSMRADYQSLFEVAKDSSRISYEEEEWWRVIAYRDPDTGHWSAIYSLARPRT